MKSVISHSTLLHDLKLRTQHKHLLIEQLLAYPDGFTRKNHLNWVLSRFLLFHRQLDLKFDEFLPSTPACLELGVRRRLPFLLADSNLNEIALISSTPQDLKLYIPNLSYFYGALYVQEGSSLGGMVITQFLNRQFGDNLPSGAGYFNPYGSSTSKMWMVFKKTLVDLSIKGDVDEESVILGAISAFDALIKLFQDNVQVTR